APISRHVFASAATRISLGVSPGVAARAATRTALRPPSPRAGRQASDPMERETGFEPATPSLEGWRSTAELFPPGSVVGRGGFEPPKAYASRFTVCPLWPLGYLPEPAGMRCEPLVGENAAQKLALAGGFEPPTHCLQGSCSAPELRQHGQSSNLGLRF